LHEADRCLHPLANFAHVARDTRIAVRAGIDWIHVDLTNGILLPNLTIGPAVVASLKAEGYTTSFDIHLMMDNPDAYLDAFVEAGADVARDTLKYAPIFAAPSTPT
jgi:ribulose-phosphate 3-epimerase